MKDGGEEISVLRVEYSLTLQKRHKAWLEFIEFIFQRKPIVHNLSCRSNQKNILILGGAIFIHSSGVKEKVPRNSMLLIVVLQDLTVYPPCLCSFHCLSLPYLYPIWSHLSKCRVVAARIVLESLGYGSSWVNFHIHPLLLCSPIIAKYSDWIVEIV